ncbi:MAG: 2-oxoacid:ferredoxin oxidoreductase subunit beta [Nitrospinae bacterium]|nr:2-oxoacid:ferredoxin oxidoreductase subunit beta [Nitrospinota bacterium]
MENSGGFHYEGEKAWCAGCGDFGILAALEKALLKSGKRPDEVLVVSGIGQAAKMPHYIKTNGFNGLHGRALPPAFGAKAANHKLTVIVASGDGDMYGEGGNHFIHNIRRNIEITAIAHNNQIYGLTKGQASPTSERGMKTKLQPEGVILTPFNPIAVAIALDAPFVARSFSQEVELTAELILEAMSVPGFAFIDVLQPCVSFNKLNTYEWYQKRSYKLGPDHDPADKAKALEKAFEWGERIPLGVIYKNPRPGYVANTIGLDSEPLINKTTALEDVKRLTEKFY